MCTGSRSFWNVFSLLLSFAFNLTKHPGHSGLLTWGNGDRTTCWLVKEINKVWRIEFCWICMLQYIVYTFFYILDCNTRTHAYTNTHRYTHTHTYTHVYIYRDKYKYICIKNCNAHISYHIISYIYIYIYIRHDMCELQFSMRAHQIHVNTTVCVPTLPTGFNADAKDHIQETPVLVGIVIQ
jgi:hypothetical protein